MRARISEIFSSIQGEGLYLGERQFFVRFFGCNLECKFCDTKFRRFNEYDSYEVLKEINSYKKKFHSISFTGGEPLVQKEFLKEMLKLTGEHGHKNYLETNGTLAAELEEVIDYVDIIAMDVKLPSSTGMGNLWKSHRDFLKVASKKETFVKAIICQSTHEEDVREMVGMIKEMPKPVILVLQPNSFENQAGELKTKCEDFKEICKKERITTCVIPQMHRVMGVR